MRHSVYWLTGLWLMSLLGGLSRPVAPLRCAPERSNASPLRRAQPNVLWLSVEDMSPRLGCYGDSTVPTPNIDRLAREGVRFTKAFCTAGVCAPSRNAIITGMYQTTTGGHNMRTLFDTYPAQTGLPKAYSIVPPPVVRAFPEYLRAAGYYATNNEKTDYQFEAPPTVWDEVSRTATYRHRAAGQPFFAVFNSTLTHESQVWMRSKNPLRADPARVPLPPFYPDTKTVRQDVARHYSNISEMDDWVGGILKELEADGLLANTIIFFWSDHGDGLPYIKREITDRGLRVPLIVRFPDGAGAGTTRTELVSMIDLAPTVLSLAGIRPPGYMQGRALYGPYRARGRRQYVFAARDRLDSAYDRVRSVHDGRYQYIRNFFPDRPAYMDLAYRRQQPMMAELLQLRDAGQLNAVQMQWFRPVRPAEELYDVVADPHQLTNLIDRPDGVAHRRRLASQLDKWLTQTGDLGAVPEKELIRRWWQGRNEPPRTAVPQIERVGNRFRIRCATAGASIGYKTDPQQKSWRVYTEPVPARPGATLTAVAQRIGYAPSDEITLTF